MQYGHKITGINTTWKQWREKDAPVLIPLELDIKLCRQTSHESHPNEEGNKYPEL